MTSQARQPLHLLISTFIVFMVFFSVFKTHILHSGFSHVAAEISLDRSVFTLGQDTPLDKGIAYIIQTQFM